MGLLSGAIAGLAIFYGSRIPLTPKIIYAEIVVGVITGLLTSRIVSERAGWPRTLIAGAVLGFLVTLPVALEAKVLPHVEEAGMAQGLLLAALLKKLSGKSSSTSTGS